MVVKLERLAQGLRALRGLRRAHAARIVQRAWRRQAAKPRSGAAEYSGWVREEREREVVATLCKGFQFVALSHAFQCVLIHLCCIFLEIQFKLISMIFLFIFSITYLIVFAFGSEFNFKKTSN